MIDIRIDSSRPYPVATVSGELTGNDADALTEVLRELVVGEGAALAVDLSGLTLINSLGLSALMELTARARLGNGRLVLVNPSPFVAGIFSATRLDAWFDICADLDEAFKRLR